MQELEKTMFRMEIRTQLCAVLLGVFLAGSCGVAVTAEAAEPPTVDALLERLGYKPEDKAALLEGKIIATDMEKTRDDQLIAAVAVQLNAPIATLAENVRKGRNIENDTATIALGLARTWSNHSVFGCRQRVSLNRHLKMECS